MYVVSPNVYAVGDDLIAHLAPVKHIPQWFPGASFQRYATQVKKLHRIMRDRPVEVTQAQMVRCRTSSMNSVALSHADQSMIH
jgi:hypothetical protein